jgi:hypothetical protein
MGKKNTNRVIDQLRRLVASRDVSNFAMELFPLLQADFTFWFKILKEQKLISNFRSFERILELRRLLFSPKFTPSLLVHDAEALEHHFDVCEFMQRVFYEIDREALAVSCHAAHPECIARAVVRLIEVANYAMQRNALPETQSLPRTLNTLQLSQMQRQFRDVLDAGNIILNSPVATDGTTSSYIVSDADLNELVRLALLYDEMRQTLDLYTYGDADVKIKRRSLVVRATNREADLAAAVGAERSTDHDQSRLMLLSTLEFDVHTKCRLVPPDASDSFDFMQKVSKSEAANASRNFGRAFANDLEFEIRGYFDFATEVMTRAGTFTVGELIRAWAFLVTVATLGQVWNERGAEIIDNGTTAVGPRKQPHATVRNVGVPEIQRNWLVRMLAREASISREKSRSLIDQFTTRPASSRIDLFYRPLLLLSDDIFLLPTPYIRGSRFERNLFALIAMETDLDQKRKGYLPVLELQRFFENAGFQAVSNFRVRVDHRELTDIDLVAFKDGVLFLGRCKILIEPDTLYDTWKAETKLDFAAEQLDTCLAHLDEIRIALFERLNLKGQKEEHVTTFILTNTRQFTERQFRDHPVVDVPYLRFILSGARGSVIGAGSGRIGVSPGRSYIAGKSPTGAELATLLRHTIHKVQERETSHGYVMKKIGKYRVHLPLMAIRTPGESKFVVTDEDIFEGEDSVRLL